MEFNDTKITVLLATLRSSGVGLNLTVASRLVLFDPWWNASVENQAIDRIHRFGQTEDVIIYRFIIKDSIEEKMLAMQKRKSQLAGAITEESKLTTEELLAMFE